MKQILFLITMFTAASLNAQSLKEALYGGKLRLDTGTVIRKGDDLSTKIDTSTRKPPAPVVTKTTVVTPPPVADDGNMKGDSSRTNFPTVVVVDGQRVSGETTETTAETGAGVPATDGAAVVKDNNAIWKEYIDSLTSTLRTEVLPSKKVKSGDYSILIDYVIGLDGTITVNNVSSFPESSYLDQQVRERLTLTAPTLTPLLNSYGKPRKAPKKQTINLSK
ncbi:MAG: hypothetical protein ABWZ25_15695 [Chitinophagaceae bacterium]